MALDLRYGGRLLGGNVKNPESDKGYHDSENTDYDMLTRIFESVVLGPEDVVVDVGCGKGRLMNWLMSRGFTGRMVGVEVNPVIADFTRARLRRYPSVKVITGDATELIPGNGTVFYLYNPFGGPIVRAFAQNLAATKSTSKTRTLVIYFNPLHVNEFEKLGFRVVREAGVEPFSKHRVAYLEKC